MLDVNDFEMKQIIVAFFNNGDTVCFRNDNLLIKGKDGTIKCQATCYRLFAVFIVGHTSLTTVLIERAKKFGFIIVLFTASFRIYEVIGFRRDANILLHKKQYEYQSLAIAKQITMNKINNQRAVLMQNRQKSEDLKECIKKLDAYRKKIPDAIHLQDIMGYEGMASRIYFRAHFNTEEWNGRKPRIKSDYINSILDIGYTVLFAFIEGVLDIYGFDLYCGVMHTLFYMRKSLVCDLVEPFRCIIDKQTKKSIHLHQFKKEDFEVYNNRYELSWKKSPSYVAIFLNAILEYKREIFLYIRQYYRCFMQQKNISNYPIFLLNPIDK
jgi:CRISPR-associated protein Cas1